MCDRHSPSESRRRWVLAGAASLTLAGWARRVTFAAEPASGPAPNSIAPADALSAPHGRQSPLRRQRA